MRYKNYKNIKFKLKMHQNPFSAGAPPGPRWGAYEALPDPLVGPGGGYPLPSPNSPPPRRRSLQRLNLRPPTQNPGYTSGQHCWHAARGNIWSRQRHITITMPNGQSTVWWGDEGAWRMYLNVTQGKYNVPCAIISRGNVTALQHVIIITWGRYRSINI